jgi:hypothetical protein
MEFYEDRIFIRQKSTDNIQYAHAIIKSTEVVDYKPTLKETTEGSSLSFFKGPYGDYKGVLVDMRGTLDELQFFAEKDDAVEVRIDTISRLKIEFHCPGNAIVWKALLKPDHDIELLKNVLRRMSSIRNNSEVEVASATIEPSTFARLCNIEGGKSNYKGRRDVEQKLLIELDNEEGLVVSAGDRVRGSVFTVREDTFLCPEYDENIMEDMQNTLITGQRDQLLKIRIDSSQVVYIEQRFIMPLVKVNPLQSTEIITIEIRNKNPIVFMQSPYRGVDVLLTIAPRFLGAA